MNGISTITQKGQVTIPKSARDYLRLKTSDKVSFEIKDNTIIVNRLPSISEMKGMFYKKGQKILTKRQMKKIISDSIVEKYRRKNNLP